MAGLQLRAFASALCSSWSSVDPRGVFSDEMIQTESNWQSDLEKTPQLGTALRLHFKETPSTETPSSPTQAPSGAQQAFLCLPTLCCQHLLLFVCLFVTGDANHNLAFAKQVFVLGARPSAPPRCFYEQHQCKWCPQDPLAAWHPEPSRVHNACE